jgi:hypothetical protein
MANPNQVLLKEGFDKLSKLHDEFVETYNKKVEPLIVEA